MADEQARCCLCGRYMSADDVLLGYSRDGVDAPGHWAHSKCVEKLEADALRESQG